MTEREKTKLMYQFYELFHGGLWYDCGRGGKLTYSPEVEDKTKQQCFDASFLEEDEIIVLMEKSIKDGVNHLFEKVKDFEYTIFYEDGYKPIMVFLKQSKKE